MVGKILSLEAPGTIQAWKTWLNYHSVSVKLSFLQDMINREAMKKWEIYHYWKLQQPGRRGEPGSVIVDKVNIVSRFFSTLVLPKL
jgi:hypothetical protein